MKKANKTALIIGGAGFVGSHLCERLISLGGYTVISIDNYFTGKEANHVEGVEYIVGESSAVESLMKCSPDILYHLGEYSRVEQSFRDIKKIFQFNKIGTFSVLEYVRKVGCKLVYAGSSTKFENSQLNVQSSPYAWSKASNTQLIKNYGEWYGINYAITYFYNVFGPREIEKGDYATVIGIFKRQMRNGDDLTVVSPGTQIRNFTHIYDIIDGLITVGDKGYGDEYGIGNPQAYSIIEVAEMFRGNIKFLPMRRGNRENAILLSEKMRDLNWTAKRTLGDYIKNCSKEGWTC